MIKRALKFFCRRLLFIRQNLKNMAQKLYILPFDHRSSFARIFGFSFEKLTQEQTAVLVDYKRIIYEGFLTALKMGVPKEYAAILVDEQFGAEILKEAKESGITRLLAVEKSGQDEFDFEYGDSFKEHIENFKPEYVKALLKYQPGVNLAKLKVLGDFCSENKYKFLLEVLASPLSDFLTTRKSIEQLQNSGVEPDIWKLEGLEAAQEVKDIVKQVQSDSRDKAEIVILGRGESDEKVRQWLAAAAGIKGVAGFAVGRTVFKEALLDYHQGAINRTEAVRTVAKNYKNFVDLFESVKK